MAICMPWNIHEMMGYKCKIGSNDVGGVKCMGEIDCECVLNLNLYIFLRLTHPLIWVGCSFTWMIITFPINRINYTITRQQEDSCIEEFVIYTKNIIHHFHITSNSSNLCYYFLPHHHIAMLAPMLISMTTLQQLFHPSFIPVELII